MTEEQALALKEYECLDRRLDELEREGFANSPEHYEPVLDEMDFVWWRMGKAGIRAWRERQRVEV